jgi:hypothetical protein
MKHSKLAEYVEGQVAKGVSLLDIEQYLRRQGWEDEVINQVLAPHRPLPVADTRIKTSAKKLGRLVWLLVAAIGALALLGAYKGCQKLALAKEIREKLRFVEVSGKVTGQLNAETSPSSPAGPRPGNSAFDILGFDGGIDTSNARDPRAAFIFKFGQESGITTALGQFSPATDARFTAATLLSLGMLEKFVSGAEMRLVDQSAFVRPERIPFLDNLGGETVALIHALVGPSPLSGAWLRIPIEPIGTTTADESNSSTEASLLAALALKPADQFFPESAALRLLVKSDGGDIDGVKVDLWKYQINGEFLTGHLIDLLRQSEAEENMLLIALLQKALTGRDLNETYSSLDSLQISDGELNLWVGKQDGLPYRALIVIKAREGMETPAVLKLRAEADLSYGKPIQVDIPQPSVDLEELLQKLEPLDAIGEALGNF